jgi:tetratricopeptide (TPR) repeat protein
MTPIMKRIFLSMFLLVAVIVVAQAQSGLKLPALSPNAKISQDFSMSSIEISYSRPSMRGRKIMGDIIPYGHVWRTGANAPTKIKLGEDMEVAGHRLKAGEYAMYTIPNKDKWEIVLSTATGNWSAEGFPREYDAARFKVTPLTVNEECQTFTINITDITFNSCKIELQWERTKIVIPVKADNDKTAQENIDKAVNIPSIPYFQAASYYYETNQKTETALSYVDKAIAQSPKAFYIWYLKARIEKKMGHTDEALAAAKKSIELAAGTPNELEYKNNNNKLINELNKRKRYTQPAE